MLKGTEATADALKIMPKDLLRLSLLDGAIYIDMLLYHINKEPDTGKITVTYAFQYSKLDDGV